MRYLRLGVTFVLASVLACGTALAAANYKGYKNGDALITPQELKQLIDAKDPKLVILAVANVADYRLPGHIPGAVRIWRPDYEIPVSASNPIEGLLLGRAEFEAFARKLGINNDTKLVIYDHQYDSTRVWWGFHVYGKTAMVLDGGVQGWQAAGYELDTLAPSDPTPGTFTAAAAKAELTATMGDVTKAKDSANLQVWDTREPTEWTGEELKKGAHRKGRIPWAKYFSWKDLKQAAAPGEKALTAFKPAADTQAAFDKIGLDKNKYNIFYCQSGVRTTTQIFVMYLHGWDLAKAKNYDGSWIEWSYHQDNPIVVDPPKP